MTEELNVMSLRQDLTDLLNRHSRENASNTPDHILAAFMLSCLYAFETASTRKEEWYGGRLEPARDGGPWVPMATVARDD